MDEGAWERELELAVDAGLIPESRVNQVRLKAGARKKSPLDVLQEEGYVSRETVLDIRHKRAEEASRARKSIPELGPATSSNPSGDQTAQSRQPALVETSSLTPSIDRLSTGERWGRFRLVSLLGKGGMGRVYRAYDPKLKRHVALKMMPGQDLHTTRRFVNEARAQARVEHDRVCKVYEVGESEGAPFITMQLIDGLPLHRMAAEMSLEQKLVVMLQIAQGVHEAHRAGLIHRDIKPGNIMVERTEDGIFKPYVLDFGLARGLVETGMTLDGSILGTPHYMSPEQARGQHDQLDRRSDVYALGATLYHILMGEPPFYKTSPAEVLHHILEHEVPPLRKTHAEIPPEVESIVLKSMEKDPVNRYHSARALAEDLGRYLDGEPIMARPFGTVYRLIKKSRKHKLAFSLAAAAISLMLFLLIWSISSVRTAETRENLIRDFTVRVNEIETMARLSSIVPAHDIRPDRAMIRAAMARIREQAGLFGSLGTAPGAYALGQGYLSLGNFAEARLHLDDAWDKGYREPEAAYALGRVYGALFHKALWENHLIRNRLQREDHRREIELLYRDQALFFMRQSKGFNPGHSAFLEASIAFYENRYEEALALLNQSPRRLAWFYEPLKLTGDIYRARAGEKRHLDDSAAEADYERSLRAYAEAALYAESDPEIFRAIAEVYLARLVKDFFGAESVMPTFQHGLRAVETALALNPDDVETLVLQSRFYYTLAEYRLRHSQDPTDDLKQAAAVASRAESLGGHASSPQKASAIAYSNLARWTLQRRSDPQPLIEKALAAFARVETRDRDAEYFNKLGTTHMFMARYLTRSGQGAAQAWRDAESVYREAMERFPNRAAAYINMGIYCHDRGVFLAGTGSDPEALFRQGLSSLGKAREIDPNHMVTYYYTGRIQGAMALGETGAVRDLYFEAAVTSYSEGLDLNPEMVHLHSSLGEVLYYQALHVWERGGDPGPLFDEAVRAYRDAIRVDPDYIHTYNNLGWAYLDQGRFLMDRGTDPVRYFLDAIRVSHEALACGSRGVPLLCLGGAYLELAVADARSGRDPKLNLKEASKFFSRSLALHDDWDYPHRSMGRITTLSVRGLITNKADPARIQQTFASAVQSLKAALARDNGHLDTHLAMARLRLLQASWSSRYGVPAESIIAEGLAALNRLGMVAKYRPQSEVMEVCFQILQSADRPQDLDRAVVVLKELLNRYPHQRTDWDFFLNLVN